MRGTSESAGHGLAQLFTIDPLSDPRWNALVESHTRSSIFHHQGWLRALARTYGYQPIVLTTAPPGKSLCDGMVFCLVESWITGKRLVSLPFSDHCDPLQGELGDSLLSVDWMRTECARQRLKYIEVRPLSADNLLDASWTSGQSFWFHTLDLTPSLETIFSRFHKNSLQRRIRRAEREHLSYEQGSSDSLLDDFYRLLMMTRRRHELLPQPRAWFRNLVACMGARVCVRVARKERVPVAAVLTLHHRNTVVYKYGCSDERFHYLAAMPFLFWKLIEEGKAAGAELLDLGRTDLDNDGLTSFKDHFGAARTRLSYLRYPQGAAPGNDLKNSGLPAARRVFSALPRALTPWAGRLLYRHMG